MKFLKKYLKLVLCAALLVTITSVPVFAAVGSLLDVDINDPSNDKIEWVIEEGYMSPALNRFYPDKKVNRGEFACILSKVTSDIASLKKPSKPTFRDVPKTYQYYRHIETMKSYINSYKSKEGVRTFKPKSYITREDAAMAVVKLLGFDEDNALLDGVESDISVEEFVSDYNKISSANLKYVEIVIVNQLIDYRIDDQGNIYFDPKKVITRKELASLLWNAEQQKNYLKEQYENDDEYTDDDFDNDYTDDDFYDENGTDEPNSSGDSGEWPWSRNIDVKFVNDAGLMGDWHSVAFVRDIDDFQSGMVQNFGLYINELSILPNGKTNIQWLNWTKGHILNIGGDKTNGNLFVKEVDGKEYLFVQWIDGDSLFRGETPRWYVFSK